MTTAIIGNNGNSITNGLVRYGSREVDPASYASDFPAWEPRPDDLITPDGVRIDTHKVLRRSDTGEVLGVVGEGYVARSNAQLAADLDAVTAPYGGRLTLGPARVLTRGARISAVVRMPEETSSMLATRGDNSARRALITLRDARDGTLRESVNVSVMRLVCTNGLRLPQSVMDASAKHTQGIAFLTGRLRAWSEHVVSQLAAMGDTVRRLEGTRINLTTVREMVQRIANENKAEKGQARSREDKIIDLVLSADGHYVPRAPDGGGFSALQVLEAATAYDRHFSGNGRAKEADEIAFRRLERLSDGDGYGARAWDELSAMVGV